jgi:hypothetical protein
MRAEKVPLFQALDIEGKSNHQIIFAHYIKPIMVIPKNFPIDKSALSYVQGGFLKKIPRAISFRFLPVNLVYTFVPKEGIHSCIALMHKWDSPLLVHFCRHLQFFSASFFSSNFHINQSDHRF